MFHLKKNSFASFLCLFLGTCALAFAQPDKDHPGRDPQKRAQFIAKRLTKELKLNDDQAAKVRQLFEETTDEMQGPPPGEFHGEFLKQLRSPTVDTAALNRDFEAQQLRIRKRHAVMVDRFTELHTILTPEQREKLAAFMEKRRDEMKTRWMKDHRDGKGDKE